MVATAAGAADAALWCKEKTFRGRVGLVLCPAEVVSSRGAAADVLLSATEEGMKEVAVRGFGTGAATFGPEVVEANLSTEPELIEERGGCVPKL